MEDPTLPSEENPQDEQDLRRAQMGQVSPEEEKSFLKSLGPGLITGAADDDPSGVGTYSVTGAQFGYLLLWLVPLCIPLMIAVQEMCGRIAIVTGQGLASVIKEHYPKWLLYSSVALLIGANIINIYADLNVMAASAQMLFGLSQFFWLTVITLGICLSVVLIPYRQYVRVLKWLCVSLGAYVIVALMPGVKNDWGAIAKNLVVPSWVNNPAYILVVVGFLGTTISPYLFFWQASEEVEDGVADGSADANPERHRLTPVGKIAIRRLATDTSVGMIVSQFVAFFIIVCAAGTLHAAGKTDINTAQDAAKALLPLGKSAYWLITLAILGTGLLAIPTLAGSAAYAVAEIGDWRYGLFRRFVRAKRFYYVIAGMVILGYLLNFAHAIDPVKGLLYSAALNGIVAPPLIIVLLFICNNKSIVGTYTNRWWSNALGWLTVVLMGGAGGYLIYAMFTGKAS